MESLELRSKAGLVQRVKQSLETLRLGVVGQGHDDFVSSQHLSLMKSAELLPAQLGSIKPSFKPELFVMTLLKMALIPLKASVFPDASPGSGVFLVFPPLCCLALILLER